MSYEEIEPENILPGYIFFVKGTGILSKLIMWVEGTDFSHVGIICCHLKNGTLMIAEMLPVGQVIRPLSVYKGKEVKIYHHRDFTKTKGEQVVLIWCEHAVCGYGFKKMLYAGLLLIPRRLLNSPDKIHERLPYDSERMEPIPEGIYQKFLYSLCNLISRITLMDYWTIILRNRSKDKWVYLSNNVFNQFNLIKYLHGEISYEQLVDIIEYNVFLLNKRTF